MICRPYSDLRCDLEAALIDGPGTTRELAIRTGWSLGKVRRTLDNMVRAGDVMKLPPVRVCGVKRPVPVYGKALRQLDVMACGGGHAGLLAAWSRWPVLVVAQPTMGDLTR